MSLHVAPGLDLPNKVAVSKNAILATSGAGKSNTAVVFAEEMYREHIPFCAIDPKGDWWGIRSSHSGKRRGLPIPILGGEHGDIPLTPLAGTMLGQMIAEDRMTCVLDVSEFETKADQSRFLTDLAKALYKHNKKPLHLLLDEADEFLPERFTNKAGDVTTECVGAWIRLIKRGRFKGLGSTLICQRSASLNKNALDMSETLIAMRVMSKRDRDAAAGWITEHALSAELADSLPSLENGQAWIWSPHELKMQSKVKFRRRTTFDSGATPDLDDPVTPTTVADVDLKALNARMAETTQKIEENDPVLLRREMTRLRTQVIALERQVAEKDFQLTKKEVSQVVVPYVPPEVRNGIAEVKGDLRSVYGTVDGATTRLVELEEQISGMAQVDVSTFESPGVSGETVAVTKPTGDGWGTKETDTTTRIVSTPNGSSSLTKAQRAVLTTLAVHGSMDSHRLALISGYSPGAGHWNNVLGLCRSQGLIVGMKGTPIEITDAGRTALGPITEPALGDFPSAFDYWMHHPRVSKAGRSILQVLHDGVAMEWTTEALAARSGYQGGTGHFNNTLGRLRSLGLIHGKGGVPITLDEALR